MYVHRSRKSWPIFYKFDKNSSKSFDNDTGENYQINIYSSFRESVSLWKLDFRSVPYQSLR